MKASVSMTQETVHLQGDPFLKAAGLLEATDDRSRQLVLAQMRPGKYSRSPDSGTEAFPGKIISTTWNTLAEKK